MHRRAARSSPHPRGAGPGPRNPAIGRLARRSVLGLVLASVLPLASAHAPQAGPLGPARLHPGEIPERRAVNPVHGAVRPRPMAHEPPRTRQDASGPTGQLPATTRAEVIPWHSLGLASGFGLLLIASVRLEPRPVTEGAAPGEPLPLELELRPHGQAERTGEGPLGRHAESIEVGPDGIDAVEGTGETPGEAP